MEPKLSTATEKTTKKYKVLQTLAVYRSGELSYKSSVATPYSFEKRKEARFYIEKEIENRLNFSYFFRSNRYEYDLVKYSEEASINTYIRYSIQEYQPF